jgi:hypothetical protein
MTKTQFKLGDKVTFARSGVFGWEDVDEAAHGGYDIGNDIYEVTEVDYELEEGIKLNGDEQWIHPDHFDLVPEAPETTERNILSKQMATAILETCSHLYEDIGQDAVRDLSQKIGLNEDPCEQCDTDTPTISDCDGDTCAMCGQGKKLSE